MTIERCGTVEGFVLQPRSVFGHNSPTSILVVCYSTSVEDWCALLGLSYLCSCLAMCRISLP